MSDKYTSKRKKQKKISILVSVFQTWQISLPTGEYGFTALRSVGTASLMAGRCFTLVHSLAHRSLWGAKLVEMETCCSGMNYRQLLVHTGGMTCLSHSRLRVRKWSRPSWSDTQISEVSFVPGRVVHVLQDSPHNPLQLFPRPLLLLQRPLHPLVVLEEKQKWIFFGLNPKQKCMTLRSPPAPSEPDIDLETGCKTSPQYHQWIICKFLSAELKTLTSPVIYMRIKHLPIQHVSLIKYAFSHSDSNFLETICVLGPHFEPQCEAWTAYWLQ